MAIIKFNINGQQREFDVDPNTPLLWVLRDHAGLVGTKYGCGIAQCGVCTVHLNGTAVRSCSVPVSAIQGESITTIEGLSENGDHPVQKAWVEHDVAQCGYCQAGQIMTAAALLEKNNNPSDDEIHSAMHGNLCRCGSYLRVRSAIKSAAKNRSLARSQSANFLRLRASRRCFACCAQDPIHARCSNQHQECAHETHSEGVHASGFPTAAARPATAQRQLHRPTHQR